MDRSCGSEPQAWATRSFAPVIQLWASGRFLDGGLLYLYQARCSEPCRSIVTPKVLAVLWTVVAADHTSRSCDWAAAAADSPDQASCRSERMLSSSAAIFSYAAANFW